MNLKVIYTMLSRIMLVSGAMVALPLAISLIMGGLILAFIFSMAVAGLASVVLKKRRRAGKQPDAQRRPRPSPRSPGSSSRSLFALPYIFSGTLGPPDSLVESISGLTGTGATVIDDLGAVPQSILFFRAMTHWLGGLGIIVIFVAIFPQIGRGSANMVNAESTGPTSSKALPRIKKTASALFTVYLIFTIAAAAAYMLCGLTFLDAIDTSFSTIATGGFSTKDASIAYYNNPVLELVIAFFMIISSANFGIYVEARKRGLSAITGDMEFRTYIGIVLAATVLMTISLVLQGNYGFVEALRETFFQSASLSSTTGFVSADFDQWPSFAKFIILLIIIVGGCGGSTAGGLKVIRLILLVKSFTSILKLHIHPRAVLHVTVSHERYSQDTIFRVLCFFFIYMALSTLWAACMMMDGVAFMDAIGVSFSTMSNAGPAFGQFGATCTYSALPDFSKFIVCLSMLFGRLESVTLLAIFIPSFWKKSGW